MAESKLKITKVLKTLNEKLAHLPACEQSAIKGQINEHININLFADVRNRTRLIEQEETSFS